MWLPQTEWHAVSGFKVGGEIKYNIFSEIRPVEHSRMKKPVAKYWTTASVARMEPHIDKVIAFLVKQLDAKFAGGGGGGDGGKDAMGESFDFGQWCLFCK